MKEFAIQRHILPVLVFGSMILVLPLPIAAAEIVSVAEIRELREVLAEQSTQLSAQQELIDTQQKDIEKQRALLQSVQVQLDRLAASQVAKPSQENAARPQQPMVLDELVAEQPESTSYGDDFAGSIPIPDSEAAIKIGGFVKMSGVYTLDPLGSDDRFVAGLIPVGDSSSEFEDSEVKVSARQSRLGIEIRDSTSYG
ncbi:MAG: hypothetical protein N2C12_02140, partial [Planctomycetales bacterium]